MTPYHIPLSCSLPAPVARMEAWGRTGASGFTLIELLVVISIIAVIASMLMPAIASARQMANRTACGSQMRQVFIGLTGYLGDNNDFYPGVARSTAYSGWGAHRGSGRWQHALEPYTGTFAVFNCPTVRRSWPRFAVTNTRGSPLAWLVRGDAEAGSVCTMAYNSQDWGRYPSVGGQPWAPINPGPMNEAKVIARAILPGQSNRCPVFMDGIWQNDGSNMQNNTWRAYWPHAGTSNLIFHDGHLEVKKRTDVVQWPSSAVALLLR